MGKIVALLLVLVFLIASCVMVAKPVSGASATENSWVEKAPMHVARGGLGVAVVNGKIYAIGGFDETGAIVGTNEEYSPETDNWTYKAPMPTPRMFFAIAVCQNKIFCIGGTTGYLSYSDVNEVYDPTTDSWKTLPPVPNAGFGLQAHVVNGKIYVMGGGSNADSNEVFYPNNNSWTARASMPISAGYVSAVVDDRIYVIGSYYKSVKDGVLSVTQVYNAATDNWTTVASSPSSITGDGCAAVTTGQMAPQRVYVYGLSATVTAYNLQIYNPENDSWIYGADKPKICDSPAMGVVNDKLFVIGGTARTYDVYGNSVGTPSSINEEYTPFGYGTVPPAIAVVSPENKTYNVTDVSLAFTLNKPAVWTGYSLDGQETVAVTGNVTLSGLSNGLHNVTVYARDELGNTGTSETISFSVNVPEPFPTVPIITASVAAVVLVSAGLLIYFKKRKH